LVNRMATSSPLCPVFAQTFWGARANSPAVAEGHQDWRWCPARACGYRKHHPRPPPGFLPRATRRGRWVLSSSFLCLAFVRILQLCRLCRAERDELAIGVVVFRREVLGLRRQVKKKCPALRPAHRAVFAGLGRLIWEVRRGGPSLGPGRCSAGIEISSVAASVPPMSKEARATPRRREASGVRWT
jgi:hypothetical protein